MAIEQPSRWTLHAPTNAIDERYTASDSQRGQQRTSPTDIKPCKTGVFNVSYQTVPRSTSFTHTFKMAQKFSSIGLALILLISNENTCELQVAMGSQLSITHTATPKDALRG